MSYAEKRKTTAERAAGPYLLHPGRIMLQAARLGPEEEIVFDSYLRFFHYAMACVYG